MTNRQEICIESIQVYYQIGREHCLERDMLVISPKTSPAAVVVLREYTFPADPRRFLKNYRA